MKDTALARCHWDDRLLAISQGPDAERTLPKVKSAYLLKSSGRESCEKRLLMRSGE